MENIFFEETCSSGAKTLYYSNGEGKKVYLHSRYDPVSEARRFAQAQEVSLGDQIVVYGFGLGYHLEALMDIIGAQGKLTVLESNPELLKYAMAARDLNKLLDAGNFRLISRERAVEFALIMFEEISNLILESGKFIIHRPSLGLIPSEMTEIKDLLTQWKALSAATYQRELLLKNFWENEVFWRKAPTIDKFSDKFTGRPVILVAAGPSLEENLVLLKKVQSKALLVSVGTALRPLLQSLIEPDFVIITDPSPRVYRQIENLDCAAPLIALPTTNPKVVRDYPGPRIFAFQQGMEEVEEQAHIIGCSLINTGGSVATTGLEIVLKMGGNPILLVGQDLAYFESRGHAKDTIHDYGEMTINTNLMVEANNGEMVPTSVSWNIYRNWIEKRIAREEGQRLIVNTSKRGAKIKGTIVMSLEEAIKTYFKGR